MKKYLLVAAALLLNACGTMTNTPLTKDERVAEYLWLVTQFEANYAPLEYKQKLHNFSWTDLRDKYRARIEADMTNQEFGVVLKEFVSELQDAHVNLSPNWNGLPGTMSVTYTGIIGKYLQKDNKAYLMVTDHLPTTKKDLKNFPVLVGDLIEKADGLPLVEYLQKYCPTNLGNEISTTRAILSRLTLMSSSDCRMPAEPSVTLTLLRGGLETTVVLPYTKADYADFTVKQREAQGTKSSSSENAPETLKDAIDRRVMTSSYLWTYEEYVANLLRSGATTISSVLRGQYITQARTAEMFLAPFMRLAPEPEKKEDEPADNRTYKPLKLANDSFDVRVYVSVAEGGKKVGYLKLPEFSGSEKQVADFTKAIEEMKAINVAGIVLDLADNGGGSLTYGLQLAAVLKSKTNFTVPSIEVRLNDNWVDGFHRDSLFHTSEFVRAASKVQYESLVARRNGDTRLSEPFTVANTDFSITPPLAEKATNVVVMANEFCASMCDIFTADLKDNGIAKVIGRRSMGAGGNVVPHLASPRTGMTVTITESLIVRANGEYVENLGVKPDKEYVRTEVDLLNNDQAFIEEAVKYAVE